MKYLGCWKANNNSHPEEYPNEDMLSGFLSATDVLAVDKMKMDYDETLSNFITRFLNTLVLNSQIGTLPAEIDSRFRW